MKALSSPLLSSLVGGLLYLATTAVLMIRGYVPPPPPAPPALGGDEAHDPSLPPATLDPKNPPPSWSYFNPDVEYLVKELKDQKLGLNSKEKELKELEARILAERLELSAITQQVARLRQEIESSILKMKEDEQLNLKRLAKTYAVMEPAGSSKVLLELEPDMAAKILYLMKDDVVAGVLDAMSKAGNDGVKRAAELTRRLRLMQSTAKK
jgi:flagellar motility protein MotE (MotC chaperone)